MTPERLWDEASQRARERLWVCEHFRVLPTDERFQRLSDAQIGLLISSWLSSAPDDTVRYEYWKKLKVNEEQAQAKKAFLDAGYTEDEVAKIMEELDE